MKVKKYVIDDKRIMEQWDWEKNTLNPSELTCGSNKRVWLKCEYGHSYQKTVKRHIERGYSCPVCSGHLTVLGVNDFATIYPEIAKEWHPTKNGELKPNMFSKKNGKKVWWQCQFGHDWEATIHDRADGTGCPICNNRKLTSFPEQAIFFYIKKIYPDAINRCKNIFGNTMEIDVYIPSLAIGIEYDGAFWHNKGDAEERDHAKYILCKEKNITLIRVSELVDFRQRKEKSEDILFTVNKRNYKDDLVKVILDIIEYIKKLDKKKAYVKSNLKCYEVDINLERDENKIKQYLTYVDNSLVELRPDLVEEWNYEKNGNLKPGMFGINSNDTAWWKCKTCGHEWKTTIIHRGGKRNSGCPECAKIIKGKVFTKNRVLERGSLAENNPTLATEWNYERNDGLTPHDVTEKRFANVWWKCKVCGYEWQASPNNRSKGVGCPACSGRVPRIGENDFKTLHPELVIEWNHEKNNNLLPEHYLPKSGKKVWWRCSYCGHEWETVIRNRTNGHGCPVCSRKRNKK